MPGGERDELADHGGQVQVQCDEERRQAQQAGPNCDVDLVCGRAMAEEGRGSQRMADWPVQGHPHTTHDTGVVSRVPQELRTLRPCTGVR